MPLRKFIKFYQKDIKMSNILVIADGKVADTFIEKISSKALSEIDYTIITKTPHKSSNSNIEYSVFDPTSRYRLSQAFNKKSYLAVFIILQSTKEAKIVYENIRNFNKRIRIVALDNNGSFKEAKDSFLNIVDSNELLANRLYDFLPNVPSTAQNIGLNEGEIMEVIVPFASAYAYRHISTIKQVNWRIAAIYRNNELLLPNRHTMIKPRDRLLLVGKPNILLNVYAKIRNKSSKFPEPYGKNFYLYLDFSKDRKKAMEYYNEAKYLLESMGDKKLIVRVVNPNNFEIANRLKELENGSVRIFFSYGEIGENVVADDLERFDIGLIMISKKTIFNNCFCKKLYEYKKLVYVFGDRKISQIKEAVVVNSGSESTEEVASVAFYIAEALKTGLSLRDYNPEGDFENSKLVIEHFETLALVHNIKVRVVQEKKNPIAAIKHAKNILLVIPFKPSDDFNFIKAVFKRKIEVLLIRTNRHPKLLIPII